MRKTIIGFYLIVCMLLVNSCSQRAKQMKSSLDIPLLTVKKDTLLDKIKGGWAGQTIGCTFGGPTEFRYCSRMIPDSIDITWPEGNVRKCFFDSPGLYDDVYMDLTFVAVLDRLGLDAPTDSFAMAFAHAGYKLWHANQSARYNILHGIMPPASGHWLNNPHADDIDYQIEADFSGLMSPGMPNSASKISDRVGHILNYGNGWYGGVYVGAMYSLAFVSQDVEFIVKEALKVIPEQSTFYHCISDVIAWHEEYPNDWKQTWLACQDKWSQDVGCPDGVLNDYNIDAMINSAYVVMGLLYGDGDFYLTMDIATRCGQDSDCNPASAAGILGTMIGYRNIPEHWLSHLKEAEDIPFAHTSISLNQAYEMSYNHALQMIERENGIIKEKEVMIACQKPEPVAFEESFPNIYPDTLIAVQKKMEKTLDFVFEGTGVVFRGNVQSDDNQYVAEIEFVLDDELIEIAQLPANNLLRRNDIAWHYQLPEGKHLARLKWLNSIQNASINIGDVLIYKNKVTK